MYFIMRIFCHITMLSIKDGGNLKCIITLLIFDDKRGIRLLWLLSLLMNVS